MKGSNAAAGNKHTLLQKKSVVILGFGMDGWNLWKMDNYLLFLRRGLGNCITNSSPFCSIYDINLSRKNYRKNILWMLSQIYFILINILYINFWLDDFFLSCMIRSWYQVFPGIALRIEIFLFYYARHLLGSSYRIRTMIKSKIYSFNSLAPFMILMSMCL